MLVKRVIGRYLVIDDLFGTTPVAIDFSLLRNTFAEFAKLKVKYL